MEIAYNVKSAMCGIYQGVMERVTITKGRGRRTSSIDIQEQIMREQRNQVNIAQNEIQIPGL